MTGQPKIVVLDGYALNPGDLDWSGLEAIGDCTFYDRTPPEETISRAQGAEIVLTTCFRGTHQTRRFALF